MPHIEHDLLTTINDGIMKRIRYILNKWIFALLLPPRLKILYLKIGEFLTRSPNWDPDQTLSIFLWMKSGSLPQDLYLILFQTKWDLHYYPTNALPRIPHSILQMQPVARTKPEMHFHFFQNASFPFPYKSGKYNPNNFYKMHCMYSCMHCIPLPVYV